MRRWIVILALAGCAAPSDRRGNDAIGAEVEAALDKKDYAAALPGLEELARRRDQWGAFVLGNYYLCAKAVKFDCARAQELFRIAEAPQLGVPVNSRIVRESRNELAWINAACEQPGFVRDADYAIRLAVEAATHPSDPYAVDTLAAAYANKGEFAEAIYLQREAIRKLEAWARSRPVSPHAMDMFLARIRLYRDDKPARFDASSAERECNTFLE